MLYRRQPRNDEKKQRNNNAGPSWRAADQSLGSAYGLHTQAYGAVPATAAGLTSARLAVDHKHSLSSTERPSRATLHTRAHREPTRAGSRSREPGAAPGGGGPTSNINVAQNSWLSATCPAAGPPRARPPSYTAASSHIRAARAADSVTAASRHGPVTGVTSSQSHVVPALTRRSAMRTPHRRRVRLRALPGATAQRAPPRSR